MICGEAYKRKFKITNIYFSCFLCTCESRSLALMEDHGLRVSESNVLTWDLQNSKC